jgi:hypothetical protein
MSDARLVIVFDERSAATPAEIHNGLVGIARPVFVVPADGAVQRIRGLLERLGDVVPMRETAVDTAREVRPFFPDGILTFNETLLPFTSALAEALDLPFHDRETTLLAVDKVRQRERLRAAGVDTVRSAVLAGPWDVPSALAQVGLPAIVKPVRGGGSRHVYQVRTRVEAQELLTGLRSGTAEPFVAEEFLAGRDVTPFGDYVSVESAVSYGRVSHIAITGKTPLMPPFREAGQFWPALLAADEEQEVLRQTTAIVVALGVRTGMVHTEFKLTEAGPRLIEFNGRMGGFMQDLSERTGGPDMIEMAGRIALGERVSCDLLDARRVAFQYWNLAPMVPCRLEDATGAAAVRALPAITSYHTFVRPPAELPGGVMVHRLDFLCGESPDHRSMFPILDAALGELRFTFSFPGGPTSVNGVELTRLPENTVTHAGASSSPLSRSRSAPPRATRTSPVTPGRPRSLPPVR